MCLTLTHLSTEKHFNTNCITILMASWIFMGALYTLLLNEWAMNYFVVEERNKGILQCTFFIHNIAHFVTIFMNFKDLRRKIQFLHLSNAHVTYIRE